jgi:hypothetical protein
MRSLRSLIVTLALAVAGCPSSTDTDTDTDTDTAGETDDPDHCPPGVDEVTFIENHVQPLCEWVLSCPDTDWPSVEFCVDAITNLFTNQPGWDECAALECVEWLADPPTCTEQPNFIPGCDEAQPN